MSFKYTVDQEKVINIRDCHVLVSAAAGSGKTAVLVERIIKLITNKENLISIDCLLIVTFTNAAAAEMRERIGNGIESAIDKECDEIILAHLIKQLTLLYTANIMTLHSFCLKLLKNYYHVLDLDPGFRIGNETELVLMKEEMMDELLESKYKEGSDSFLAVIESFASGKDDSSVKALVFQIYRFAMSNPWPMEWMSSKLKLIDIKTIDEFLESVYYKVLLQQVNEKFVLIKPYFQQLEELMALDGGPDKYKDTVNALYEIYETSMEFLNQKDYKAIEEIYKKKDIPALSRKTKGYDKELASEAKDIINQIKKDMDVICQLFFNEDTILDEIKTVEGIVNELVSLTQDFKAKFTLAKRDKNLIDFNDIEHLALELLYKDQEVSEIAKGLKNNFVEVLVDEYQDTNEVQEAILLSVSHQDDVKNNLFMVGDLKQSIYKFRLAKPEIFKNKYENYTYEESQNVKIDLAKNFRSRREIVDFCNHVFEKIMSKNVGDVDYTETVKLNYGAFNYTNVEADALNSQYLTEINLIEKGESKESKATIEARHVASEIQKLITEQELTVYDKEINGYRPIQYHDICILMRSPSSYIHDVKNVFDQQSIPYLSDVSSGYFDAVEVQILLNLLKVIDNPLQDIPLVSVLRSALVGISEQELLEIRDYLQEGYFYEALMAYQEGEMDPKLSNKIKKFLVFIEELKEKSFQIPLNELIEYIYKQTGFTYFVQFMENGLQRMTNLNYLVVQAKKFEESSYKGLFNFIRYIEHIKKYDIEIPTPLTGISSGVTLLSIHKSKGLEYPIVFIMGIHKQFNLMDLRKNFVIHQELGFGCDYIHLEKRYQKETSFSKAIKLQSKEELLSEELRLLYVAITRAKEKLFISGVIQDYEAKVLPKQEQFGRYISQVPSVYVKEANSYLDLLMMSCPKESPYFHFRILGQNHIEEKDLDIKELHQEQHLEKLDVLKRPGVLSEEDENLFNQIRKPYPYIEKSKTYITLSVSELKEGHNKRALGEETYEEVKLLHKERTEKVPSFIQQEEAEPRGAAYGLVMHKILSLLEPKENYTYDEIKQFVDALFEGGSLEQRFKGKIPTKSLLSFTQHPIYQRITKAWEQGLVFREQPFVLGMKEDKDLRMIQGVIDLYFIQDNKVILLDYKTDFIEEGQEALLIERYVIQLSYYKKAIEDILNKQVLETYIYSISLNKLIKVTSFHQLESSVQ